MTSDLTYGLRECGLVVDPRAPLPVPARADLEVERAVHLVLLSAEDGGKVLGHLEIRENVVSQSYLCRGGGRGLTLPLPR